MFIDLRLKIWLPTIIAYFAIHLLLLYRRIRYGYPFRRIKLTRGYYALVDECDFERLNRHKWQVNVRNGRPRQAGRTERRNQKSRYLTMHRVIMNPPLRQCSGQAKLIVDHINRNPLDNRRANLRLSTPQQNSWNRSCPRNSKGSKYTGVSLDRDGQKWRVRIVIDGESRFLGYYDDEKAAAMAFDKAARKHRGQFAFQNFPD